MEPESRFSVVINEEAQYSAWPADRALPAGWSRSAFGGSERECLDHIDAIWTDMRPKSLLHEMRSPAPDGAPRDGLDTPQIGRARAADTGATAPSKRWLLRRPTASARRRLFCFPFAGVGASAFRRWPLQIGEAEVCAIQLPGRENRMREPAYSSFESFAADAASALAPFLDRPFALFGHCMGALLAYALLVELQRRNLSTPARLFVSSSLVPHLGFFGPFHPSMSDERLVTEMRAIARSFGEEEPLPELLALSVRTLRKDVEMCFGYRPPGPRRLPCPITTVGWSEDRDVRPEQMVDWSDYGSVTHRVLPGDNFTVLSAPPALLAAIETDFQSEHVQRRD